MEETVTRNSSIVELANTISQNASKIDEYLRSQGLPTPSFAIDAPPIMTLPPLLMRSRDEILEACTELQALTEGPVAHLTRLTSPTINILMSLQAIYRFKIASSFALEEEVSYEEIAFRCKIDEQDARRLIRMAIANHIFQEPRKGFVAHSAISKFLVHLPLLNQWVGLVCDEMWPSGCRTIEAMIKWPGSQEPQHTAFALVNNGDSYFDALGRVGERSQRFADGMRFLQSAPVFDLAHLFHDLEWDSQSCPSSMVDVGGSQGSVSIEILRRYPLLECEVQDLDETVQTATVPEDVTGRLIFRAHNFFTEQPRKNADVYFLRSILHDWSDKYAVQILKHLVPALKHGSKVILNEVCLPEPNTLPYYHAQLLRGYDLAMKQNFNSKERDADEWRALFQKADSRFKCVAIRCNHGSILSVIEATWG